MTTPTKARELARDAALDLGCIRQAIGSLADQVEALTKERDALMVEVVAEKAKKTIWQQQYEAAIEQRDALMAAAKLAVAALDDWYYGVNQDRPKASVFAALQALKAAGVQ